GIAMNMIEDIDRSSPLEDTNLANTVRLRFSRETWVRHAGQRRQSTGETVSPPSGSCCRIEKSGNAANAYGPDSCRSLTAERVRGHRPDGRLRGDLCTRTAGTA